MHMTPMMIVKSLIHQLMLALVFSLVKRLEKALSIAKIHFVTPRLK